MPYHPTSRKWTLPTTQEALIQSSDGTLSLSTKAPLPRPPGLPLHPGEIIVKTMTVALNPTDYKMHANFPSPGAVAGCDFVGVVVAVGGSTEIKRIPNVRAIKLGDRVCAAVHGNNPLDHSTGTFAEYVRCEAELCLLVPPHMSWKEAAALGGIGYMTLGLALWHSEGLGLASSREKVTKENEGEFVLVFGYRPITTCSTRNFSLVASRGAEKSWDYASPNLGAEIRTFTKNQLYYALDCITDSLSVSICLDAISRVFGKYAALEYIKPEWKTRKAVRMETIMGYEIFGKIELGERYSREASNEKRKWSAAWMAAFQDIVDKGKVVPHPVKLLDGGLCGVADGLEKLKRGEVGGQKLVLQVSQDQVD